MKAGYFRELDRYTHADIEKELGISSDDVTNLIKRLRALGIIKALKPRKNDDPNEEINIDDIDLSQLDGDDGKRRYVFDYVGVIVLKNAVIKCYPKYINTGDKDEILKLIANVLRKAEEKEKKLAGMSGLEENIDLNMLSIVLYILYDFVDNGIYSNQKDINVLNGDGEIDWDKTINETYAVINNNTPLYLDFYTKNSVNDDEDYFRQLHMYIITECSNILEDTKLDKIFSLPIIQFEVDKDLFIDEELVLSKITKELNEQFVTRKQIILKTIYTFISQGKAFSDNYVLGLFGTKKFNLIWEKACAYVLDNQLNLKLSELNTALKGDTIAKYDRNATLKELIEKTKWIPESDKSIEYKADDTLRPDIISIYKKENKEIFAIWDAKYYAIRLDQKNFANNPGVESVTKQYLYNLAYKEFIKLQQIGIVNNAFIFPSEDEGIELLGTAKMSLLEALELNNIKLIKMPAHKVFQMYVDNKKMDIGRDIQFI